MSTLLSEACQSIGLSHLLDGSDLSHGGSGAPPEKRRRVIEDGYDKQVTLLNRCLEPGDPLFTTIASTEMGGLGVQAKYWWECWDSDERAKTTGEVKVAALRDSGTGWTTRWCSVSNAFVCGPL
jgi:hypothetical protein